MLSRTASLGQQSLELTWLVCVRDTCTVSSWNSAGIRALKVECDTSILRTPTVASAVSSRSLPRAYKICKIWILPVGRLCPCV
eukprot:s392_g25.t1